MLKFANIHLRQHLHTTNNMAMIQPSFTGSKWNFTIFGLKMMVKSGPEKFILKTLHVGRYVVIFINEFVILGTFMK